MELLQGLEGIKFDLHQAIALSGYILIKIHRAKFIFEVRDVWPDIPIGLGVLKNK